MSESTPPMSKIVIQTMIKGLEESKKSIEGIRGNVHNIDVSMSTISTKTDTMEGNVQQLLKLVRDGNGQKSLISRVTDIENEQKSIQSFIDEQKNSKKTETAGKWQLKVAVVMGSLALIGTIASAIIELLVK